jgi:hypothetical protein
MPGGPSQPPQPPPPRPVAAAAPPWWAGTWGGRLAADVILTVAGASLFSGVIGLLGVKNVGFEKASILCVVAFGVLSAAAVGLRWVEGVEDARGTLAIVALLFVPACFLFADDLANPSLHDNLQKVCIAAGILTVAAAVTAVALPSAVAGALATLGLGAAIGSGVWLGLDAPTQLQISVATAGLGLFMLLAVPRLGWLPRLPRMTWLGRLPTHPMAPGWILGTSALVLVGPPLGYLAVRNDGFTIAAAVCGGFGLLILAQLRRNLAIALGAFVIVITIEAVLLTRYFRPAPGSDTTGTDAGTAATAALIVVGVAGIALVALVSLVLYRRAAPAPLGLPATLGQALLGAAFVLALISLWTVPGNEPGTPIVPVDVGGVSGGFGTPGPIPFPAPSFEPFPTPSVEPFPTPSFGPFPTPSFGPFPTPSLPGLPTPTPSP